MKLIIGKAYRLSGVYGMGTHYCGIPYAAAVVAARQESARTGLLNVRYYRGTGTSYGSTVHLFSEEPNSPITNRISAEKVQQRILSVYTPTAPATKKLVQK